MSSPTTPREYGAGFEAMPDAPGRRGFIGKISTYTLEGLKEDSGKPDRRVRPGGIVVMAKIESKLAALGLVLPPPLKVPTGIVLPFQFVRVSNARAFIAGHGPQADDGSVAKPLGKVGRDLTVEEGYAAARLVALSILASLKRTLGDLDRVVAWNRAFGMVNSAPGFNRQPAVINGFSDLILELYGPDVGAHSRSAVGMAELPFDIPVEVEGEVEIAA